MAPSDSHLMSVLRAIPAWLVDGDLDRLASLFAEDAVWQGIRPYQVCAGRDEIVGRLSRAGSRGLRLTGLEAHELGDRVVVHAESPDLPETEDLAAGAPALSRSRSATGSWCAWRRCRPRPGRSPSRPALPPPPFPALAPSWSV